MLALKLICVGRMKEPYYRDAFAEYQKRLGVFCRFETVELVEQRAGHGSDPSEREIAAALEKEAVEIEKQIPAGSVLLAMCVEGTALSSEQLASQLGAWSAAGRGRICILIGGSCGLAARLKQRADLRLSLSEMTFPHHLFRVMAAEQLYRAFTILEGRKYHK